MDSINGLFLWWSMVSPELVLYRWTRFIYRVISIRQRIERKLRIESRSPGLKSYALRTNPPPIRLVGGYIYIADFSCVRVYDIARKLVATLAGICGRLDEAPTSLAPPTFTGQSLPHPIASRRQTLIASQRLILRWLIRSQDGWAVSCVSWYMNSHCNSRSKQKRP